MGLRQSRGLEEFFAENWESAKPNITWSPNVDQTIPASQFQVNLTYDNPSFFLVSDHACAATKDGSYKFVAIDE